MVLAKQFNTILLLIFFISYDYNLYIWKLVLSIRKHRKYTIFFILLEIVDRILITFAKYGRNIA